MASKFNYIFLINHIINFGLVFSVLNTCENIDYTLYKHRSSTTIYEDVRGVNKIDHEDCQPQEIWMLIRHGTRHNNQDSINRTKIVCEKFKFLIVEAYQNGKGYLCPEDIKEIRSWRFDDLLNHETHFLTENGRSEMEVLGRRMRENFPTLFNETYDPARYYFGYSKSQRSIASYRRFAKGLFADDETFDPVKGGHYDSVPEFDCSSLLLTRFEPNYEQYPPSQKFADATGIFDNRALSLSTRTGLPKELFTKKVIRTFYETCTYESAKYERLSPWCRVFGLDDLTWMGHREEFIHYSHLSYGSKYSDKEGCIQMKDLISTFSTKINDVNDKVILRAYVGHDVIIEQFVNKIGCFKDAVPLTSNFSSFNGDRLWRQSTITPFGANLAAVLYRCDASRGDDYKLQFYLNESPIGCCMSNSTAACSWNEFKERYYDFTLNCDEVYCDAADLKLISNFAGDVKANGCIIMCIFFFSFSLKYFSLL